MTVGIAGFCGERLSQVREARGLTGSSLADLVGVSPPTISLYERKGQKPKPEVLARIASTLRVPEAYFLRPVHSKSDAKIFFRCMHSATKASRIRAYRKYEWAVETVDYLTEFFDFPNINLPQFDVPQDFRQITDKLIEDITTQLREYWNLGKGPITNLVSILETNGFIVLRGSLDTKKLDAFSEVVDDGRVFIFLGSDKNNLARSRFDAAHEVGHCILHRNVDKKSINKKLDFKIIEDQAHYFATSLLLPAQSFTGELIAPSLDSFRAMKMRWKVSIGAMIKRCENLDLLDKESAKRLWINRSRRGWKFEEPLDDLPPEQPKLLSESFKMLIDNQVRSQEQIADDLLLPMEIIEELCSLECGYLGGNVENAPLPEWRAGGNIIPFRRRL